MHGTTVKMAFFYFVQGLNTPAPRYNSETCI